MARSVSSPYGAVVAYDYFEPEDEFEYEFMVENFRDRVMERYPSASERSGWIGREDRIVAANGFAFFGISEYCGMIAYWVVARNDVYGSGEYLAENWVRQIADGFRKEFGVLRSVGRASNGEQFFEKVAA